MTSPADKGFPAYGLELNPFLLGELDPLTRPLDLKCVSWVDGWKSLDDAEELVNSRVAEGEPVFFVVDGESKTGPDLRKVRSAWC